MEQIKTINPKPEEGVLQILRFGVVLQILLLFIFLANAALTQRNIQKELASVITLCISLLIIGLLVFHPKGPAWFRRTYLPILIGFQSLISVSLPLLFTSQGNQTEFFTAFWLLIPSIFIPLSIVQLQYTIRTTFIYTLLVNLLDLLILFHINQVNPIEFLGFGELITNHHFITNLLLRIIFMDMIGYILSLLVRSIRNNAAQLAVSNKELAELNHDLEIRVHDRTRILHKTNQKTLEGWVRLMELRHFEPIGHTQRMIDQCNAFGRKLGLSAQEMEILHHTILLHDVGKLGVPDQVLLKNGPLTDEEWQHVKLHVEYTLHILQEIDFLQPSIDVIAAHHERWNGTGYPNGLMKEDIPYLARVFSVIEVYDILTHATAYRAAWQTIRAEQYLRTNAGILFDPLIINQFLGLLETQELDQIVNHL